VAHKIQQTLFNPNDQPECNWAYVVELKWTDAAMRDALGRDPRSPVEWETAKRPNHFRLESNAVLRAEALVREFKRAVEMRLVEFRVVPKYVGYVPPQDESWIV